MHDYSYPFRLDRPKCSCATLPCKNFSRYRNRITSIFLWSIPILRPLCTATCHNSNTAATHYSAKYTRHTATSTATVFVLLRKPQGILPFSQKLSFHVAKSHPCPTLICHNAWQEIFALPLITREIHYGLLA